MVLHWLQSTRLHPQYCRHFCLLLLGFLVAALHQQGRTHRNNSVRPWLLPTVCPTLACHSVSILLAQHHKQHIVKSAYYARRPVMHTKLGLVPAFSLVWRHALPHTLLSFFKAAQGTAAKICGDEAPGCRGTTWESLLTCHHSFICRSPHLCCSSSLPARCLSYLTSVHRSDLYMALLRARQRS